MADLFISYSRHDRERIERLAAVLEHAGWSVWWDRRLLAGDSFDKVIETAIGEARGVIVAWSEHSVASDWVRAEAAFAVEEGKLIPVRLDATGPPLRFRHVQTIDLSGWQGGEDEAAARTLVADIASTIGSPSAPIARAQPTPQPSPAPARTAAPPAQGRPRGLALAAAVLAVAAVAGAGALLFRSGGSDSVPSPPRRASAFDGTWRGPMTCSATKTGFPGFSSDVRPFKVSGGKLAAQIDVPALGGIDHETYEGRIDPDGTAEVAGHGENTKNGPYAIHFTGKVEGGTLTLSGVFGSRDCTLVYRRQ